MRTTFRLSAAVLAIAVLGVLVLGSAVASAKGGGKKTLRITAVEDQAEFLDLGTPGDSLGDEFVFSETLMRRGQDVGMSGVVCTVTNVGTYDILTLHCVGTLSLRKGQITLQGLVEIQGLGDPGPFRVAITGGTGAFRGAGGEAVYRQVDPGPPVRSVYKLRFDSRKKKNNKR
jgi:hypothetical protein